MLRELRQELREIREILDPQSNLLTFIIDMRGPGDDHPDGGWVPGPNDILLDMRRPKTDAEMAHDADYMGIGWQRLMADTYGSDGAERQQGGLAVVDWSVPYQRAHVDPHPTRLGDGTVTVETPGLRSPLTGSKVVALPVPARWLGGVDEDTPATVEVRLVTIGALAVRYGESGLLKL